MDPPGRWFIRAPVFLKLAFAGMLGGLLLACNPSLGLLWQGLGLIAVGFVSLAFAIRGIGHRKPGSRKAPAAPTFDSNDPEVAALPATTTGRLREHVSRVRERQKRARE